ncbi:MFS transporter [Streptomyces sp. NPDC005262]|uniref:MFS transporter n=1 Tax=Streptomyces sp. NPDC005262 TaxID=3364710 RepID=UPI00367D5061
MRRGARRGGPGDAAERAGGEERRSRRRRAAVRAAALRADRFAGRHRAYPGLHGGFGMFTQFIGISYLVQTPHRIAGYGFSASVLDAAVVYLLPGTVASLIAAQFGGVLVRRIGARVTLAAGAGSGVLGFGWLAVSHGSPGGVVAAGLLTGIAVSFGFATLPAFIVAGVPVHQSGIANGINSIARSLGSSLGSAVITALLSARLLTGLPPRYARGALRGPVHALLRSWRRRLRTGRPHRSHRSADRGRPAPQGRTARSGGWPDSRWDPPDAGPTAPGPPQFGTHSRGADIGVLRATCSSACRPEVRARDLGPARADHFEGHHGGG